MIHSMSRVSFFAVALALAPRAQDGFANLIPADSKFAVYVDLQAALDFVGRDLVERAIAAQVSEQGNFKLKNDWSARLEKDWGMDPLRDLKGLLLFGDELEDATPSFVLLANEKVEATLGKLFEMGALEQAEHDGKTFARVSPEKIMQAFTGEEGEAGDEAGYLHVSKLRGGMRALMFGESLRQLAPQVAALGGGRGQRRGGGLALAPHEGCIAYVEVADAFRELMDDTPASRISKKTKRLTMQVVGGQDNLSLHAALETETAKDAKQVAAIVNGLKALVGLVESDGEIPEEVMEALSSAQAQADGNLVTVSIDVPRTAIAELRRELESRERGARRARDDDDSEDEPQPKKAGKRRSIR